MQLCLVATPYSELRLRLARHPGLIPALLHLVSAARPVPESHPQDRAPYFAASCLHLLVSAPVVIGELDPEAAASAARPAPVPWSSRPSVLQLAGREGFPAELAAARAAQEAFLAAPGEPVATLADSLDSIFKEKFAERYLSAFTPGADGNDVHSKLKTTCLSRVMVTGNQKFATKHYALAALVYGALLGFCPEEDRLTRAAALGNRAECNLALGGRARLEDAARDAAAALAEAQAAGPEGAALAHKARGRLQRARDRLSTGSSTPEQ
eukprot:tig00020960_g16533.t1